MSRWGYTTPPPAGTPSQPKQFRRKERVTKTFTRRYMQNGVSTPQTETWHGTVLNPEYYVYSNGDRNVTVRWDHQHPWEKGYGEPEKELIADASGITQFDTRRYELRHLAHAELAMLHRVLGDSNDQEAVAFIKKLPELPS